MIFDDTILVFKCRRGDKEALLHIYQKYRNHLLMLAIALSHNKTIAEDAVHDVIVAFAEKIVTFRLTGNLKNYLSVCLVNRIRNLIKSKSVSTVSLDDDIYGSLAYEPSRIISINEELNKLSSALANLPHEQSEIIVLHFYCNMKFSAIAKSLGISINTVKGRYRYGINKLKSIFENELKNENSKRNKEIV